MKPKYGLTCVSYYLLVLPLKISHLQCFYQLPIELYVGHGFH